MILSMLGITFIVVLQVSGARRRGGGCRPGVSTAPFQYTVVWFRRTIREAYKLASLWHGALDLDSAAIVGTIATSHIADQGRHHAGQEAARARAMDADAQAFEHGVPLWHHKFIQSEVPMDQQKAETWRRRQAYRWHGAQMCLHGIICTVQIGTGNDRNRPTKGELNHVSK